jgi:hypothetical protein
MVTWNKDPDVKVEAGATDISSDTNMVEVHRPENGISRAIITVNDFYGENYIANVDAFTVMKVSLKETGTDGWTKVFEGKATRLGPSIGEGEAQTMAVLAFGYGRALRNTHCDDNFGNESESPGLNTPHEIWDDLIDNYINKSFGSTGAATGYAITKDKVAVCANPDLNFIEGGYRNNLTVINDVLLAYQGYQGGSAGMHWFVDPSKNLWIDTIGAHTVDTTNWPTWWRTDQAGSTLVEGTDFTQASFHKIVWPHFANKVVLYCDLRKPGTDIWTEDGGPTWGNEALASVGYSTTEFIVGSHSLECRATTVTVGEAYYPGGSLLTGDAAAGQKVVAVTSVTGTPFRVGDTVRLWDNTPTTETAVIASIAGLNLTMVDNLTNAYQVADAAICKKMAGWDLTKIGSSETIPSINFYFWKNSEITEANTSIRLYSTDEDTDYYESMFSTWTEPDDKWIHRSLPIGPHWKTGDESRQYRWDESNLGTGAWSNINGIAFHLVGDAIGDGYLYIDDLHFAGKIIREAYNQTNIDANGEVQKIVRYDVAVDDSLKASDDTGTAGHLAYGELLTRLGTPTTGVFQTPLAVDALPGQLVHVHGDAYSGAAWRVDADFRAKEIVHTVWKGGGSTAWDVTSDVLNTFVPGYNDALSRFHRSMHTDPEMMNLRTTGLDPYITRLSKDYS